jgi:hypothetical protein
VNEVIAPGRRITVGQAAHVAVELARERRWLRHLPTWAPLQTMARLDGSRPCSYGLDAAVNWLPGSLPAGFPHGASGLCFTHRGSQVVVLPDGAGFALL